MRKIYHKKTKQQALKLNGKPITSETIKYHCKWLEEDNSTKVLDLSGTKLNDVGIQYLAEALIKNKSLEVLDISCNDISSKGVKAIARALKTNESLTTLYMQDLENISEKAIAQLLEGVESNFSLTDFIYHEYTGKTWGLSGMTAYKIFTSAIRESVSCNKNKDSLAYGAKVSKYKNTITEMINSFEIIETLDIEEEIHVELVSPCEILDYYINDNIELADSNSE